MASIIGADTLPRSSTASPARLVWPVSPYRSATPYSNIADESTLIRKYFSAASVLLRLPFDQHTRKACARLLSSRARNTVMNSPAEASSIRPTVPNSSTA